MWEHLKGRETMEKPTQSGVGSCFCMQSDDSRAMRTTGAGLRCDAGASHRPSGWVGQMQVFSGAKSERGFRKEPQGMAVVNDD